MHVVEGRKPAKEVLEGGERYRLYRIGRLEITTRAQQRNVMDVVSIPADDIRRLRILGASALRESEFLKLFGPAKKSEDGAYSYGAVQYESVDVKVYFEKGAMTKIVWSCLFGL